jgi:hypothetical protein
VQKQMRSLMFHLSVCAFIALAAATGQTLSVTYPSATAVTPPLSQLPDSPPPQGHAERRRHPIQNHRGNGGVDPVVQTVAGPLISAMGGINFDGPGANGYAPSDSNIAVGPNHIFAAVNSVYQIFSKSGASLLGPKSLSSLWAGVGGGCSSANAGDVIAQYDKIADRWILTQLSSLSSPYGECIAVSTTNDPTGTYATYYYSFGSNLPDYPKFGVWPTTTNGAYLATYNQFANGNSFVGAALCAYDRTAMLAGTANPVQICGTINDFSYLPSDLDGSTPPTDGTPGYFATYETLSSLRIWTLAPNFANPANSVLTQVAPDISVASFSELCNGGTCIPQAGTNQQLDSLGDRPMYRLAFRNLGDHQAMVFNHSVTTGVRWYELRSAVSPSAMFSLYQQGTFGPDSTTRWMGSAAMDQAGDIAVGYSASSSSIHPAIRYSGRVPTDTLGTLESESTMFQGTGSQTSNLSRWGDYSSLRIDPSDDCTFWYVNEYLSLSGAFNWSTRIGSFKFTGCGAAPVPDFSLSANPSSVTIAQGNPANSSISVTSLNGYSKAVTLSVTNCPSGATCSFGPNPVAPAANGSITSTLTITGASAGSYTLTISGTDSTLTHTTMLSLTVNPPPDFSLSANPTSVTVTQGNGGSSTITVTPLNGFNSPVSLTLSGCPANTTCTLNPTTIPNGSGTSTLSITTTSSSPTGTVKLTISGNSGVHSTTVSLTINPPAGNFTVGSVSITVSRRFSKSGTVVVSAVGASSSVTLSVSGLPSGVTASFSPNPVITTGNSQLTISANRRALTGTYHLTITGKNGTYTNTGTLNLTIQ